MIATLVIHGKKYEGKGQTASEAIGNLRVSGFTKSKALLTVGEKTIVLYPVQTARLFSQNPSMREVALKTTANRF